MTMHQLPMFGVTLIVDAVTRTTKDVAFEFRRAATDEHWCLTVPLDCPNIEQLSRPGAVFALVELASIGQVGSRGRF